MLQESKNPIECHFYQKHISHIQAFLKAMESYDVYKALQYVRTSRSLMSSSVEFSHEVETSLFLYIFQI